MWRFVLACLAIASGSAASPLPHDAPLSGPQLVTPESWYVSALGGVDNTTCGSSPDTPCKSVGFTWGRAVAEALSENSTTKLPFVVMKLNACGGTFSTSRDRNLTLVLKSVAGLRIEGWWSGECSKMEHPTAEFDLMGSSGAFMAATAPPSRSPTRQTSSWGTSGLEPYVVQLADVTIRNAVYDPSRTYFIGVHTNSLLDATSLPRDSVNASGLLLMSRSRVTEISAKPIKINDSRRSRKRSTETERESWVRSARASLSETRGLGASRLPMIFLAEPSARLESGTFTSNLLTTLDAIVACATADVGGAKAEAHVGVLASPLTLHQMIFEQNGNCTVLTARGSVANKAARPSLELRNVQVTGAGDPFIVDHGLTVDATDAMFLQNQGHSIMTINITRVTATRCRFRLNKGSAYVSQLAPLGRSRSARRSARVESNLFPFESAKFEDVEVWSSQRSAFQLVHSATFNRLVARACNANNGNGGAISVSSDRIIKLDSNATKPLAVSCTECKFDNNNGMHSGGAVAISGGAVVLSFTDSNFSGNFASKSGGAIFLSGGLHVSQLNLLRTRFDRNAANADGGAIFCGGQTVNFEKNGTGCEFSRNTILGDVENPIACDHSCQLTGLPTRKLRPIALGDSPGALTETVLCAHQTEIGSPDPGIASPVKFWSYIGIAGGVLLGIILIAVVFIKWRRNVRMPTTRYVVAPGDDEEGSD
jgi:Chlamydia polymorphic membrane protein (Chlamydia_PMP) repeat